MDKERIEQELQDVLDALKRVQAELEEYYGDHDVMISMTSKYGHITINTSELQIINFNREAGKEAHGILSLKGETHAKINEWRRQDKAEERARIREELMNEIQEDDRK